LAPVICVEGPALVVADEPAVAEVDVVAEAVADDAAELDVPPALLL
jgi:hypothetical protein